MSSTVNLERLLSSRAEFQSQPRKGLPTRISERVRDRKTSSAEIAEFCTQLSVLLQARISLHRALDSLARQARRPKLRTIIESLASEIRKGASLSAALAQHPGVFDPLFVTTAEVGQESGRLAEVLSHLARHLEKMHGLRRKFLQAMTYPALVIGVACFAVTFLLVAIVPTFAEMFRSFQVELPISTRFILVTSEFLTKAGPYLVLPLVGVGFLFRKSITDPRLRTWAEKRASRLPFLGDVFIKTHVARFCRTLGTLLKAQVSLVEALEVTRRIITNEEMRRDIQEILAQVKQGRAIAEPVVRSRFFPPMVAQMIAVGEQTSELDEMLLKVADYYEKELDGKVDTLSTVIEPVLILFLGLVVAAILISMYLPMFDLVNVVGAG